MTRVQAITRPTSPSPACRAALGLLRASHRRPTADDARRGGDRPSNTDLELHAQHHIRRSSNRVVHSQRATSCRTARRPTIRGPAAQHQTLTGLNYLQEKTAPHPARHRQHFMDPRWTQSMQTFVPRQPSSKPLPPTYHMRTTSCSYGTFTNHLHISRQSDRPGTPGGVIALDGERSRDPPSRCDRHGHACNSPAGSPGGRLPWEYRSWPLNAWRRASSAHQNSPPSRRRLIPRATRQRRQLRARHPVVERLAPPSGRGTWARRRHGWLAESTGLDRQQAVCRPPDRPLKFAGTRRAGLQFEQPSPPRCHPHPARPHRREGAVGSSGAFANGSN